MMSFARIGSTVTLLTTIGEAVAPVASAIGFAASPLPVTFTPPFTPAAAWWMWNSVSIVLAGQPVTVRLNPAIAAVIFPVPSLVVSSVNVPLPEQLASAFAIAGTSFVVLRSALNVNLSWGVGVGATVGAVVGAVVGDGAAAVPPHAAARRAVATRLVNRRIDTSLACTKRYAPGTGMDEWTKWPEQAISRILARTVISLGRRSPSASSDLPGDGAGRAMVPLRDLAARRACPFHPACAGSSLWRWSSPHGGRVLPASVPCAVRTFLDGFRRRDRLACSDHQF